MSILKRNIAFNLFGQGAVIILGFVTFKYIYAGLGEDALGIIYFSLMLSTIFTSALDMGLSKTTVREIAAHNVIDPEYISKLTQTFSLLYWLVYTMVSVLFVYFLTDILGSWINLTSMDSELAYYVLLILGPTTLLAIPKSYLTSICIGMQRMDINNLVDISVAVIQQLGLIILLASDYDIIVVAYWIGGTNILRVIIYLFFATRLLSINAMLPIFSMSVIRRIKGYTTKMMWISLVLVIHKQLDKVLVSKLLPIGVFGIYSFIYSSISKTSLVAGAVSQATFPFFSESDKLAKKKEALDKFIILQDLLVFATVPIFVSVFFFSIPIFTFLLDAEKALSLQIPVMFLSISFYLSGILRLARIYMFAISKPEPVLRSDILSLFIVTPSTVFLVYSMGINGAALAWVIFYGVLALMIMPGVYKKELSLPPYLWLKSVLTAMFLVCVTYLPAGLLVETFSPGNIPLLTLSFVAASITYGILALNLTGSGFQHTVFYYAPKARNLVFMGNKG